MVELESLELEMRKQLEYHRNNPNDDKARTNFLRSVTILLSKLEGSCFFCKYPEADLALGIFGLTGEHKLIVDAKNKLAVDLSRNDVINQWDTKRIISAMSELLANFNKSESAEEKKIARRKSVVTLYEILDFPQFFLQNTIADKLFIDLLFEIYSANGHIKISNSIFAGLLVLLAHSKKSVREMAMKAICQNNDIKITRSDKDDVIPVLREVSAILEGKTRSTSYNLTNDINELWQCLVRITSRMEKTSVEYYLSETTEFPDQRILNTFKDSELVLKLESTFWGRLVLLNYILRDTPCKWLDCYFMANDCSDLFSGIFESRTFMALASSQIEEQLQIKRIRSTFVWLEHFLTKISCLDFVWRPFNELISKSLGWHEYTQYYFQEIVLVIVRKIELNADWYNLILPYLQSSLQEAVEVRDELAQFLPLVISNDIGQLVSYLENLKNGEYYKLNLHLNLWKNMTDREGYRMTNNMFSTILQNISNMTFFGKLWNEDEHLLYNDGYIRISNQLVSMFLTYPNLKAGWKTLLRLVHFNNRSIQTKVKKSLLSLRSSANLRTALLEIFKKYGQEFCSFIFNLFDEFVEILNLEIICLESSSFILETLKSLTFILARNYENILFEYQATAVFNMWKYCFSVCLAIFKKSGLWRGVMNDLSQSSDLFLHAVDIMELYLNSANDVHNVCTEKDDVFWVEFESELVLNSLNSLSIWMAVTYEETNKKCYNLIIRLLQILVESKIEFGLEISDILDLAIDNEWISSSEQRKAVKALLHDCENSKYFMKPAKKRIFSTVEVDLKPQNDTHSKIESHLAGSKMKIENEFNTDLRTISPDELNLSEKSDKSFRKELVSPGVRATVGKRKMADFYNEVMKWSISDTSDTVQGILIKNSIPLKFKNTNSYMQTFEPFVYLETKANFIRATKELDYSKASNCNLEKMKPVDGYICYCTFSTNSPDYSQWEENSLMLIKDLEFDNAPFILCRLKTKFYRQGIKKIIVATRKGLNSIGKLHSVQSLMKLSSFAREYESLINFNSLPFHKSILDPSAASPIINEEVKVITKYCTSLGFNKSQIQAVSLAFQANDGFVLIQGPPGTGKTKTIIGLTGSILNYESDKDKKLLICAPSNAAIDEIARRLLRGVMGSDKQLHRPAIIRIGNDSTIHQDVLQVSLSRIVEEEIQGFLGKIDDAKYQLQQLEDDLDVQKQQGASDEVIRQFSDSIKLVRDNIYSMKVHIQRVRKDKSNDLLQKSDIVYWNTKNRLCTLSGAGSDICKAFKSIFFEAIIIDEACQAVELSTLIPLRHHAKKCILVGDPEQLPPTVLSQKAINNCYEMSLFQRLLSGIPKSRFTMLNTQYRMHPEISNFPNQAFYESRLENASLLSNQRAAVWHKDSFYGPIMFYDVYLGREVRSVDQSLYNQEEINVLSKLIQRLFARFPSVDFSGRIGVISFYKEQVHRIRSRLKTDFGEAVAAKIDVNTVDGFQGQEKDIIILSCVRSNPKSYTKNSIGFLNDRRRMNVAITRARCTFILLGNEITLKDDELWRSLVQDLHARDKYRQVEYVNQIRSEHINVFKFPANPIVI